MVWPVDTMLELLRQVLPVYLLFVAGAVMRRLGVTKRETDDGILLLVFHVMYPCFIIDKILGSESVKSISSVSWGIGLGFGITVLGFLISWLIAGLLRYEKGQGKRTFAISAGVQNFGYTAIPVVEQLWIGTGAIAVLFVHNLGVELAIWSVGVMLIAGKKEIPWRRLVNGPVVAVILGLLLVAIGWDGMREVDGSEDQGVIRRAMSWMGAGAFPVAIFVTGAVVMDLLGREKPSWRAIAGGVGIRMLIMPAIILTIAKFTPAPVPLKQVLIVQAAMPAALTPILLAKLYGGKPAVAVDVVVSTTIVSLVTLPIILAIGKAWLGYG